MNKTRKIEPRLPGLSTTLLVAGIFAVPIVLWGDRWPWLVVLPVAIMVILTVRSEWLRLRASKEKNNVQVMEATLILDPMVFGDAFQTRYIGKGTWISIREISNNIAIDDYETSRQVVDEKLSAVA